jgi:adenylate kinase
MKLPKVILLLGKPLSGKGTQAQLLAERLGYELVKVSDIIRHKFESAPQTKELEQAKLDYIKGDLVNSQLVISWLKEKIRELNFRKVNFVLDGAPRTFAGARALLEFLDELYRREDLAAVVLEISDQTAYERAQGRARKVLDQPQILKERLKEYQLESRKAEDFLQKQGVLIRIKGEQGIEEIYSEILTKISNSKIKS